jgi:hypothetical protein
MSKVTSSATEVFNLNIRSFSINAMYGPKKFKTPAARDWEMTVMHQLNSEENLTKFSRLREAFNPDIHGYSVSITVYYPESKFYTKGGDISAHTHDVSNYEKPLVDLLFLPKYFDQQSPYGCRNLNVDDKYIIRMFSRKAPGPDFSVKVVLKVVKR